MRKFIRIWTSLCIFGLVLLLICAIFKTPDMYWDTGKVYTAIHMEEKNIAYAFDFDDFVFSFLVVLFVWAIPLVVIGLVKFVMRE